MLSPDGVRPAAGSGCYHLPLALSFLRLLCMPAHLADG